MIVAGFGFRAAADVDSLHNALRRAVGDRRITSLATVGDKADTPVFRQFAKRLGLPVRRISHHHLPSAKTQSQGAMSQTMRQTGSVAEATALLAAGPGARLVQTRIISTDRMATCAIAEGDTD
ncbi:cobalamin biosynthesis protein [Pontibaca salina]|uniref:Cobalamin biosynthesis protein n=1 Tax=Pontibaca salina TaxID=2795731 RepID=A0A934HQI3_9RHOB|nr:cobalamin biosynthesis protein [Pontibaca salina]MBI6628760.1 cobalamin biosynthesis protein [Pontibaca salina]